MGEYTMIIGGLATSSLSRTIRSPERMNNENLGLGGRVAQTILPLICRLSGLRPRKEVPIREPVAQIISYHRERLLAWRSTSSSGKALGDRSRTPREPSQGTKAPPESSAGFQPAAAGTAALRSLFLAPNWRAQGWPLAEGASAEEKHLSNTPLELGTGGGEYCFTVAK